MDALIGCLFLILTISAVCATISPLVFDDILSTGDAIAVGALWFITLPAYLIMRAWRVMKAVSQL